MGVEWSEAQAGVWLDGIQAVRPTLKGDDLIRLMEHMCRCNTC